MISGALVFALVTLGCVAGPENGTTVASPATISAWGFLFDASTTVRAQAWRHVEQDWMTIQSASSAASPLIKRDGEELYRWELALDLSPASWWSGPGGRGEARVRFQQAGSGGGWLNVYSFEKGGFNRAVSRYVDGDSAAQAGLGCASPVSPVINLRRNGGLTNVYLTRHAEKAADPVDPPLTAQGVKRAEALADELGYAEITTIIVSTALRTKQTAAPLAARRGLTPVEFAPLNTAAIAQHILANHAGGNVLVVGHTNTIPAIITALGATPPLAAIPEDDFDNLFLVHRVVGSPTIKAVRRTYGAVSP